MYYYYFDESGIPRIDKIQPSSPYFIFGGVILDDSKYAKLCALINEYKQTNFPTQYTKPDFRLHASYLLNCRGLFSGFDSELAHKLCLNFYKLLSKVDFLTFIATAIHKERLLKKYGKETQDPYIIGWLYSCERFDRFLSEKGENTGKTVVETRGPGLDKLYREKLEAFLSAGTKYRWISRVQNPVFDSPSKRPPLEVADFVCYALHKKYNKEDSSLFDIIKNRFRNSGKKIDGYGLVEFPK